MNLQHAQRGFTMIELMIAVVIGLVISGAAVLLVASIVKSDSETIRASRLTQELRATTEVIAREMRRARSVGDPIANVDYSSQVTTCNSIDNATSGCIKFGYDCDSTIGVFKSFSLVSNNNKVYLNTSTSSLAACPTASNIQISSNAVKITALTFTTPSAASANDTTDTDYTITVTGQLAYGPGGSSSTYITNPTRSYTQHVRIRSAAVQ